MRFKEGHIGELCSSLLQGGTTPSIGACLTWREVARRKIDGEIPKKCEVHVMIRPRGGDFVYTYDEVRAMIANVKAMKRAGCDGVVFGCLTVDGSIEVDVLKQLVRASKPELQVTFHRAFDMCVSMSKSLHVRSVLFYREVEHTSQHKQLLVENGVDRVLTSGGADNALSGATDIAKLVKRAKGLIIIAAGAGVKHSNVSKLIALTSVSHVHASSACMTTVESRMKFRNKRVSMGKGSKEYTHQVVSEEKVRELISKIQFEKMDELTDNLEMLVESLNLLPSVRRKAVNIS